MLLVEWGLWKGAWSSQSKAELELVSFGNERSMGAEEVSEGTVG